MGLPPDDIGKLVFRFVQHSVKSFREGRHHSSPRTTTDALSWFQLVLNWMVRWIVVVISVVMLDISVLAGKAKTVSRNRHGVSSAIAGCHQRPFSITSIFLTAVCLVTLLLQNGPVQLGFPVKATHTRIEIAIKRWFAHKMRHGATG